MYVIHCCGRVVRIRAYTSMLKNKDGLLFHARIDNDFWINDLNKANAPQNENREKFQDISLSNDFLGTLKKKKQKQANRCTAD